VVDIEPAPSDDPVAALTAQVHHLERALVSRDVIGQAKGILMERYRIAADEAFEKLRLASQHTNRKVYSLAEDLAATGQWPPPGYVPEPPTADAATSSA
jgi:AmiR/NasT family two-component response regulator